MLSIEAYLEDIENRLNEEEELRLREEWLTWKTHKNPSGPFHPAGRIPRASKLIWPQININDTFQSDDLAILRELCNINGQLESGSRFLPRVRANTGVGNIPTLFGAELFFMAREADTLPNVRSLGEERTRSLLNAPTPSFEHGNFPMVERITRRFLSYWKQYPKIGRFIRIEQPDLQGPMDNLELLWESDLFYALYDDPETIHALLQRLTDTIASYMTHWLQRIPSANSGASYFNYVENGFLCLRDDSAMNLSPDFFSEYIAPYDERLLKQFGGIVHFCGKGDHFIDRLARLDGLCGINMTQPHLNDTEKIFTETIDKGLHLCLSAPASTSGTHDMRNLTFLC